MPPSIDDAISGYKRLHRALLAAKTSRWHDLDISMQQLRAMSFLWDEEEVSIGGIAELFGHGLPAASVLADRLVRAGYVDRRDDPADRRRVLLSLSRTGRRLVSDLREGSHPTLRRWMASLTPDELEALARGWNALADVAAGTRDREATTA